MLSCKIRVMFSICDKKGWIWLNSTQYFYNFHLTRVALVSTINCKPLQTKSRWKTLWLCWMNYTVTLSNFDHNKTIQWNLAKSNSLGPWHFRNIKMFSEGVQVPVEVLNFLFMSLACLLQDSVSFLKYTILLIILCILKWNDTQIYRESEVMSSTKRLNKYKRSFKPFFFVFP